MPALTPAQIEALMRIIRDASTAVAISTAGYTVTPEELERLQAEGYIEEGTVLANLVYDSFVFGQVMSKVPGAKDMSFPQFQAHLKKHPVQLSRNEQLAVGIAQQRAGQYCVGLGNRYSEKLGGFIVEADAALADKTRKVIQDKVATKLVERQTRKQLRTELGRATGDWSRDWDRIAATESQMAHQEGFLDSVVESHGDEEKLAKVPEPDACKHCLAHYLEDGKPKVRPASWWRGQGVSNAGRKTRDWKTALGALHPNCRCQLVRVPEGWGFDEGWNLVPLEDEAEKSGFADSAKPDLEKADQLGFNFGGTPRRGGPFIGPRGGKWADPQHTIPWKDQAPKKTRKRKPAKGRSAPAPAAIRASNPRTLTPEFRAWFGDWTKGEGSRVLKHDGTPAEQYGREPVKVFHGTPVGGFRSFSKEKDKGHNIFGKGFYFTEARSIAEEYTAKDEDEVLASTIGFRGPKGEITHLSKAQAGTLRENILTSANPNWDQNSAWAITRATEADGRVNLKTLISEFWKPTGSQTEHRKVVESFGFKNQTGRMGDRSDLKGTELGGDFYGVTGGVRLAAGVVSALGGRVETAKPEGFGLSYPVVPPSSPVQAVFPKSQVFECYMNIRRPVDMDQPADFEAVRRLSRYMNWHSEESRVVQERRMGGDLTAKRQTTVDQSTLDKQEPYVTHVKDMNDHVDFNKLGIAFEGDGSSLEITPENLLTLKKALVDATKGKEYDGHQILGLLHLSDPNTLTWGDVHYLISDMHRWRTNRDAFTGWAKHEGHDGIAHTGGWNIGTEAHRVWIAFEPNQIKSVDSSSFDPKADDIYKSRKLHGRMEFQGLQISIENRKGSIRRWYDPHTKTEGTTKMLYPYGYIRRTEGTDGDHVDVFVGPHEAASKVYVVHQLKAPAFKEHDEDKVMLGFYSAAAAKKAYLAHYNDPRFYGSMTAMSIEAFRNKVFDRKGEIIKGVKPEQLDLFGPKPKPGPRKSKAGGGPFIGPRGGKWADPQHTVPWKLPERAETRRPVLGNQGLAAVTTVFVNVSGGSERKRFVPRRNEGIDLASKNIHAQITAHEIPKTVKGRERFVEAAGARGLQLMIDSGEFGRFGRELRERKAAEKEGRKPVIPGLDFDKVFTGYEQMAEEMLPHKLTIVAPDRIADPAMTAELRSQYAKRVKALMAKGVNVIVPIQARNTAEIERDYIAAVETFGPGIILGFPTAAKVLPMKEILPALATLYTGGRFPKVHFLGGGRPVEMSERTAQIVAAAYFAGRDIPKERVLELVKDPATAARSLRNVKTADVLVTGEADIALQRRMHEWARAEGLDPDHEDFDETEAWLPFFEAHPEEYDLDLERGDKPELFRQMARDLVQMDTRVVGSVQQYGKQHDPISGLQVKAGPEIAALPKAERHPLTLQAYLESREHQTERYVPPASSAWDALWGTFRKSFRKGRGPSIPFQPYPHPVRTMGNWGDPARTAGENVRSDKTGKPREDWPPQRTEKKRKRKKQKLEPPQTRLDVVGLKQGKDWDRPYEADQVAITTRVKEMQDSTESHENLKRWQRARVALRQDSKLSAPEINR